MFAEGARAPLGLPLSSSLLFLWPRYSGWPLPGPTEDCVPSTIPLLQGCGTEGTTEQDSAGDRQGRQLRESEGGARELCANNTGLDAAGICLCLALSSPTPGSPLLLIYPHPHPTAGTQSFLKLGFTFSAIWWMLPKTQGAVKVQPEWHH